MSSQNFRIFFLSLLLFLFTLHTSRFTLHAQQSPILRLDLRDPKNLKLMHFRTGTDPFRENKPPYPLRTGLERLNASGSAQFSAEGLAQLMEVLRGRRVVDVDLRQESHGFADNLPVSWFADHDMANKGKSLEEVENDEKRRLAALLNQGQTTATVIKTVKDKQVDSPYPITVKTVATERELTEKSGVPYYRFTVTDHTRPTDAQVEEFLKWTKSLDPKAWLHFHCEAGDGRTTTFLVMYDILKNAQNVGFIDIVKRQWLLGGIDLLTYPPKESWKYPLAVERTEFLRNFYQFVKENGKESWAQWSAKKKKMVQQEM